MNKKVFSWLKGFGFWLLTVAVLWLLATAVMSLGGCAALTSMGADGISNQGALSDKSIPHVYGAMNWMVSGSIIGIALSVVAFFNGSRAAIGGIIGSGVALVLALTIAKYATAIAIGGLLIGAGFLVWTLVIKHRALKEVITGVQNIRRTVNDSPILDTIDAHLGELQSPITEKIVKQIKKGINVSIKPGSTD